MNKIWNFREVSREEWIAFAILILAAGMILFYTLSKIRTEYGTDVYPMGDQLFTEQLKDGDSMELSFALAENTKLDAVRLAFVTYGVADQSGQIEVEIKDTNSGNLLGVSSLDVAGIKEWEWQDFLFEQPVPVSVGENITLTITARDFP